ncbi:MAG: hypothetical protein K0R53_3100 [Burkholderiales bacterium]|nr:hypothetical protein [Burkholderiales bacterium]
MTPSLSLADTLSQRSRRLDYKLAVNNVLLQRGSIDQVALPGPRPLVSCLMVTRGRLFPSRFAVDCFRHQTYANRELLLVCDGPGTEIEEYCRTLGDERIRIVYPKAPVSSLGELRNLSLQAARGEWVCQWDDDDLYHPQRLELGMAVCMSMQAVAFFLSRWLLWSPSAKKIGISGAREWEGSMLALKSCVPAYPGLARGEDTAVAHAIIGNRRVVLADAPWLYTYVQTGANTWTDRHFEEIWQAASLVEDGAAYDAALRAVSASGPHLAYASAYDSLHGAMQPAA